MSDTNTQLLNVPTGAQQRFNDTYITSTEICEKAGVTRPTVLRARQRGVLPDAISVGGDVTYIWERKAIQPYLDAWLFHLASRKGELV